MMFCLSVDLFLTYCFISLVCIITMIGPFSSFVDSAVGLDVSSIVIGYFRSHTRTMMSAGSWNYRSTYCFGFWLNFLYWSLASLWLALVSKTAPKSSTSLLKFRIYDVYYGRLKQVPHPPRPWWPIISPQPPCPFTRPPLLVLDFIILLWDQVVVASPSVPLLPTAGG